MTEPKSREGPDPATLAAWGLAVVGGMASVAMLTLLGFRSRDIAAMHGRLDEMKSERDRFLRVMEEDQVFRDKVLDMLGRIEGNTGR